MSFESRLVALDRHSQTLIDQYQYNPDRLMRIADNVLMEIRQARGRARQLDAVESRIDRAISLIFADRWEEVKSLVKMKAEYRRTVILCREHS